MPRKTDVDLKILDYVRKTIQKKGYAPSVREIANEVGLKSPSSVHYHLRKLQERGELRTTKRTCRGIILAGQDSTPHGIENDCQLHPQAATMDKAGIKAVLKDMDVLILDCIRTTISERGYSPSIREIADAVGLKSPSSVHTHLHKLQDLGFIRMGERQGRTITLVE